MNPLFLLDPALTLDEFDHHYSLFNEINLTCREMEIDLHVLASAYCKMRQFDCVTPLFKSQTYYFFKNSDDYFSKIDSINAQIRSDYAQIDFCAGARILMHTASPWHLLALAENLRSLRSVKIALGLTLPSSFWTKDPELQALLDDITYNAMSILERSDLFAYSETGSAGPLALPISVPLMSDTTLQLCRSLTNGKSREPIYDTSITFGFFGGLFKHKGVSLIMEASKRAISQSGYRIIFFVPPHHLGKVAELGFATSKYVVFNTAALKYEDYLTKMSSVSAVLCCYDKAFFSNQMSGVVTEAAALGLPIIVSRGTALHRFLLTYSPGADVPVAHDAASLGAVLALPHSYWQEKRKSALIGASLVQELKSCRRFLTIALGY